MSAKCRPWYPWYPNDFYSDENVKMMSFEAESVYRRILDALWQTNKCRIKDNIKIIHRLSCKDLPFTIFESAYKELDNLKVFLKKGGFIQSTRLLRHYNECLDLKGQRRNAALKRWKKS